MSRSFFKPKQVGAKITMSSAYNCNVKQDIERIRRSIHKQGNMIITRFFHARGCVKLKLFSAYCLNLYGCEIWDSATNTSSLKSLSTAYHDLIKRCVDVPRYSNNHLVCHDFQLFTFESLLLYRKLCFLFTIRSSFNKYLYGLLKNQESLLLFRDIQFLLNKFDIVNLDLGSLTKSDSRRMLECIIRCRAMHQWTNILDV